MNKYVRPGSELALAEPRQRKRLAAARRATQGAAPPDVGDGSATFDEVVQGTAVECPNCGERQRVKTAALADGVPCASCGQRITADDAVEETAFDDEAEGADPRPRILCECGRAYRLRDPLSLPRCCPSCRLPWSTRNVSFSRASARRFRQLVRRAARRGGGEPAF